MKHSVHNRKTSLMMTMMMTNPRIHVTPNTPCFAKMMMMLTMLISIIMTLTSNDYRYDDYNNYENNNCDDDADNNDDDDDDSCASSYSFMDELKLLTKQVVYRIIHHSFQAIK